MFKFQDARPKTSSLFGSKHKTQQFKEMQLLQSQLRISQS